MKKIDDITGLASKRALENLRNPICSQSVLFIYTNVSFLEKDNI